MNKTVEQRVLDILVMCPAARYDDMLLMTHYYNLYSGGLTKKLSFSEAMVNHGLLGLPCFETICRARRRVQSICPFVARKEEGCGCACTCG